MKVHAKRESECKGEAWGRGKVKGDLEGRYSKDDMKEGFEDENLNNRLRDNTDMDVLDDGWEDKGNNKEGPEYKDEVGTKTPENTVEDVCPICGQGVRREKVLRKYMFARIVDKDSEDRLVGGNMRGFMDYRGSRMSPLWTESEETEGFKRMGRIARNGRICLERFKCEACGVDVGRMMDLRRLWRPRSCQVQHWPSTLPSPRPR